MGFAPFDNPRYAVSVIVEHGGGGSKAAAPIARDVLLAALYGEMPPLEAYPAGQRDGIAERQKAMLAILDSFDAEMKSIAEDVKVQRAKIVEANADYDITRADLEKMYADQNLNVGQISDAAKTHRFELCAHCSEAEWKKIFAHTKGYEIKYL